MNKIYLLLSLLIIFGCEDKINKTKTEIVDRPTICPEPNPELQSSPIDFAGIETISSITETSMTLNWNHIDGFHQYHIISIEQVGNEMIRKIIATISAPNESFQISGLTPNTKYNFLVRAIDKQGYIDDNMNVLSDSTLDWPSFANVKSLRFNGSQAVELTDSNRFHKNNKATVSLWFKTSSRAQNDQRLVTLHRGPGASSALSLGLLGEDLKLYYTKSNNQLMIKSHRLNYFDNKWHHLAITYSTKRFTVYFNGKIILRFKDTFSGFGTHPAHIGSYTGLQKGFSGNIDEVSFFNSALNKNHIKEIFNGVTDLENHSQRHKLISWYRNGDSTNDTPSFIEDVIANNHGTGINLTINSFEDVAP